MNKTENRIKQLFERKDGSSKIMSLFLTAGYPDLESTVELITGFEDNGADMIELGMPFSDPLADGPTIQYSSSVAIEQGITMRKILQMVEQVREISPIPIILMGYLNPLLQYGVKDFCHDAGAAGVDGLIIPDLPLEESGILENEAQKNNLSIIYLVAPNTPDERMQKVDSKSEGFVYCISVTGVTGTRDGAEVAKSVGRFIDRVKKNVNRNPKMVGFGIKSHSEAHRIAADMDGFIVGSALIDNIREHYPQKGWKGEAFAFVRSLKYGNN